MGRNSPCDVCDQRLRWDRRVIREVARAEEALFFAGDSYEDDGRAFRFPELVAARASSINVAIPDAFIHRAVEDAMPLIGAPTPR